MFFQEITPDTSGYMVVGYAIAFAVMAIYLASLLIRWRNLNRDLEMLADMDKEKKPRAPRSPRTRGPKGKPR